MRRHDQSHHQPGHKRNKRPPQTIVDEAMGGISNQPGENAHHHGAQMVIF